MICPLCASKDHLPGCDECSWCQFPLSAIDTPMPIDRVDQSLMFHAVEVLHPRPAVTVSPHVSLAMAMQLMVTNRVGALLVVEDGLKLVGILTERDFLTKLRHYQEAEQLFVADYMTVDPETVSQKDPLAVALGKMSTGGYRHLPVVNDDYTISMISVRDILRHILQLCQVT